jgi:hypothetical protein
LLLALILLWGYYFEAASAELAGGLIAGDYSLCTRLLRPFYNICREKERVLACREDFFSLSGISFSSPAVECICGSLGCLEPWGFWLVKVTDNTDYKP